MWLQHVGRPWGMPLSGGQVQRVAAARMFVRQPALLIFDYFVERARYGGK